VQSINHDIALYISNYYINNKNIKDQRKIKWIINTFNVILRITNAISKNLPSSGTKLLPIMTHLDPPDVILWHREHKKKFA
jgi:hypothetical protein